MSILKTGVCRETETELPWKATWAWWTVSNTMEKLYSFLKVYSCHRYIYRALFYQNYEFYLTLHSITVSQFWNTKKYSVGPILYQSVNSSVFRPSSKAPAAFEADNPTCGFLSGWLAMVRTCRALYLLCSLNTHFRCYQPHRFGLHVLAPGKAQRG